MATDMSDVSEALRTILTIAGWSDDRARGAEIIGGADPMLPTPFRIGETSAAALGAVGLAVSELWELRTGRRQQVAVDTRQATASLRSGHYMKLDGSPVSTERNAVMGFYPARNGRWSYIHANFPNHRAAALGVLGVPEDREAVRCAVAKWDALELEEAIIAAKGAGGMVRTMAEWARHPQGAAVASLPVGGHDGTLQSRMRNTILDRHVQAKTGTLNHVRALAGYAETRAGEKLVFAMIANHFTAPAAQVDAIMEKALAALLE